MYRPPAPLERPHKTMMMVATEAMKANYGRRAGRADSDHADDSILRFMLRMPHAHVIWRMGPG